MVSLAPTTGAPNPASYEEFLAPSQSYPFEKQHKTLLVFDQPLSYPLGGKALIRHRRMAGRHISKACKGRALADDCRKFMEELIEIAKMVLEDLVDGFVIDIPINVNKAISELGHVQQVWQQLSVSIEHLQGGKTLITSGGTQQKTMLPGNR